MWSYFPSLLLTLLAGCVVGVAPRLPIAVERAVNRDEMRVLHTQTIDLYYPAKLKRQAYVFAQHAEYCIDPLRRRILSHGGLSNKRIELIFADLPLNNAFATRPGNGDHFAILGSYWTMELATETGLVPDPGYVGCHELTHYIQGQQTLRSLGLYNLAFGYLITPQWGLDSWFWEGLAVYYEQALQPGTGRPSWPAWEGMFHAAVAGKRLQGGDFNENNRRLHWGNHYLYGSHFIDYLVRTHGEFKLWKLIQVQGESFFFPFIVNQRFRRVYGKTLSHLLDDYAEFIKREYPVRDRPANQRTVRPLGMNARLARAPDGTEAVISDAMDVPPTLTVYRPDGSVRYATRLTEVLPNRKVVSTDGRFMSGLRFSRDGRKLYFVALDKGLVFQEARLLSLDLQTERLTVLVKDLGGSGGDISPDGRSYLFVRISGQGHWLSVRDLESGQTRDLAAMPAGTYLTSPTFSPDGRRVVASLFDGSYGIALFDAQTGELTSTLHDSAGPLSDATFIDDDRLLMLAKYQERFQVFVHQLSTGVSTRISDVPYLALQPRAQGQTVRFLNREGYGYTLDEIPLPSAGDKAITAHSFGPRILADVYPADAATPATPPSPAPSAAAPPSAPVAPAAPTESPVGPSPVPVPLEAVPVPADAAPSGEPAPLLDFANQGGPSTPPPGTPSLPAPAPPSSELNVQATPGGVLPPPRLLLPPLREPTDEPYAVFPRLVIPSVRKPLLIGSSVAGQRTLGLYIGGTDALGKHRWGGQGSIQPTTQLLSGAVGYLNTQLSPLQLMINASQSAYDDKTRVKNEPDDGKKHTKHDRVRQRDITFTSQLVLRTSRLSLSVHTTDDRRQDATDAAERSRALSGGTLAFQHRAVESTPMTGARRGYEASLLASYYPASLGTLRSDVTDLRAGLQLHSPLPLSKRHTFHVGLRGRSIVNADGEKLLEIGGTQGAFTPFDHPDEPSTAHLTPGVVPQRRFREGLRGFETLPFVAQQIGIADVTYRYPLIVDSGTATSLWILPSFLFRQLDFEGFASAATASVHRLQSRGHLALGGAVTARFFFWILPFTLTYQLSKRFSDEHALQHLISIGTPLDL